MMSRRDISDEDISFGTTAEFKPVRRSTRRKRRASATIQDTDYDTEYDEVIDLTSSPKAEISTKKMNGNASKGSKGKIEETKRPKLGKMKLESQGSIFDVIKKISNSPTKNKQKNDINSSHAQFHEPITLFPSENSSKGIIEQKPQMSKVHEQSIIRSQVQINNDTDQPWVEKYVPKTSGELLIHKRKLKDLTMKIQNLIDDNTGYRILVVTGPSGSGKSIACKIIANELLEKYIETHVGNTKHFNIEDNNEEDKSGAENEFQHLIQFKNITNSSSIVNQFTEFLNSCKLIPSSSKKLIFIDELPNLSHFPTQKSFQSALKQWCDINRNIKLPPMIICITDFDIDSSDRDNGNGTDRSDTKGLFSKKRNFTIDTNFICETVMGIDLMKYENKYLGWERIKFNPIAKTFVKKGLSKIIESEMKTTFSNFQNIKKEVTQKIEELSSLNGGDYRNCVMLLEMYWKFGLSLTNNYKDNNLNLFHLVGKLIYGTQHENNEMVKTNKLGDFNSITNSDGDEEMNFLICLNIVNEIFTHGIANLTNSVFENIYLTSADSQELTKEHFELVDDLSITDQYGLIDEIKLLLATYSTRVHLSHINSIEGSESRSHGNKMRFSRESKVFKELRKTNLEIQKYLNRKYNSISKSKTRLLGMSRDEINLIDGFYESRIINSKKWRFAHIHQFNSNSNRVPYVSRLGGNLKNGKLEHANVEIGADELEDVGIDDVYEQMEIKSINDIDYFDNIGNQADGIKGNIAGSDSEDDEFLNDPIINNSEDELSDYFSDDSEVLKI